MRRTFLTRTILCLIPTVLAAALVMGAYLKDPVGYSGFKLGIDLRGGTILVYEVDQEASKQSAAVGDSSRARADSALAEALKRRLDPTDLSGVIVRPLGESRVEIVLPYGASGQGGTNQADVERIKEQIREVGKLEFRILANEIDDKDVLTAIQEYLRRAQQDSNGAEAKELAEYAKRGQPPPVPAGTCVFKGEDVRYEWVEIGKLMRAEKGLSTKPTEGIANKSEFLKGRLEAARRENQIYVQPDFNPDKQAALSAVYFSRPTESERLTPAEREAKKLDYFMLTRVSERNQVKVGGDISISANVGTGRRGVAVSFNFNSRGGDKFYQVTSNNAVEHSDKAGQAVQRQLAIILDNYLISVPTVNEPIRGSGVIEGSFTRADVERMVNLLRSGALPATLKPQPVSQNTIGPTLGADTIRSGLVSVILSFAAVLAFMIVYYRFAGIVATVALFANLILTVGFMVAVNATFTLPGLAGLVLMLGMAVDANVLIYERLREERDRGMNLATALRNGYDRALPTIIDTHLSSIFTAIVLYVVGNDQLKGFGVSLTVGLIISLFTSLYMTRLIFDYWQAKGWLTQLRMLRLFARPNINFMKIRYQMFALTAILTVLGLGIFLMRGQKSLNVDFVGGTTYTGELQQPMDIGSLRKLLSEDRQQARLKVASVKEIVGEARKTTYEITYEGAKATIVALAHTPDGSTAEAREAEVKRRASILPDWSVEQIFRSGSIGSTSPYFTVRTTEREPEIVLAAINRLFSDEAGNTLLTETKAEVVRQGDDYLFRFSRPVSLSFAKTLIERQLQSKMADSSAADAFDIIEQGEALDGRYSTMRVKIKKDANEGIQNIVRAKGELDAVMNAAAAEFGEKPQAERLENFDGTLASETRGRALYAIVASWIAILLYLWFRFGNWTFGLAAVICLVHDLCFTLGAIALCHYLHDTPIGTILGLQDFKIDLPAVAALLTLVGYSVNDTIVVFDRIKEVRGKNPLLTAQTINDSVNQTLSRTVLASLTVFLVVGVLYVFGGEGVHLFAFVMVIGVIVGTYSSIYIASPLLLIFGEGRTRAPIGGSPAKVETAGQPA